VIATPCQEQLMIERILRLVMPRITRWLPGLIPVLAALGPLPDQVRLLQMITGYWISQAISAGAALGLFDRIKLGRSFTELAIDLSSEPEALHRLLRALASAGVVSMDNAGKPSLTRLGTLLTSDHPESLQAIAIACGQEWYRAWGELPYSVTTGKPGFEKVYGKRFFEYTQEHAAVRTIFDLSMQGVSSMTDMPIALAYDFSRFKHLTDIGGGTGSQLLTVLRLHGRLKGCVFDLPAVVNAARAGIRAEPAVARRISFNAGDFMQGIPSGSDAYFMKNVLHDWPDAEAVCILKNCRAQMQPHSRLLIAEHVIKPGNAPQFAKLMDLMMLVNLGGKERTRDQYRHLLAQADLRLTREFPTLAQVTVLEAAPCS
jgi:O-methyltransferase domain/Dimerisation domain